MKTKNTFAITALLASVVMVSISGATQNAYSQLSSVDDIPANARIDLYLVQDGSGSIGSVGFGQINQITADALQNVVDTAAALDPPVDLLNGKMRVTFIVFANSVSVECAGTILTDQTDLDALKTCIANATYPPGDQATCLACGVNQVVSELMNNSPYNNPPDVQLIDIVTDGDPNVDDGAEDEQDARTNAINEGVDSILLLGIQGSGGVDSTFLQNYAFPQPAVLIPPGNFPADTLQNGFAIVIDGIEDYEEAFNSKLAGEVIPPCVADPELPECVGGEFLSVDSSALLIAGLSANMSLIVPVAAGIAGIGAYYIRSRMNKD